MATVAPGDETIEAPPPPEVPLQILQVVRSAHTQHGLRHGDYGRYRSPPSSSPPPQMAFVPT